ncbi:MAG: hypothetical protein AAFX06_00400 [Planctomycetota bacterium]
MTPMKSFAAIVCSGLLLFVIYTFASGKQYGTVSDQGYQYAKALYSCCNRQDGNKLEEISRLIDEARAREELGEKETRWLAGIIEQGREGDWANASKAVRQLMVDQVTKS